MLNWVIIFLIAGASLTAAFNGRMEGVTKASIDSAKTAVELAIGLIGQMAVWLGMMRILRDGGFMNAISRVLTPVLRRLFPEIPGGHPALGAMVMNIAANMLGLGNAATPFGLKAMRELDTLNTKKGVATNSMALFLAINTSGVAVMPLGVVAVRAMMGAKDPAGIFVPSIIATACSTLIAVVVAKLLENRAAFSYDREPAVEAETKTDAIGGMADAEAVASLRMNVEGWRRAVLPGFGLVLLAAVLFAFWNRGETSAIETARAMLSHWVLPVLMTAMLAYGLSRGVKVYESFVKGAKEGFDIAVMIIPYLVAILVAIGMFRASGLMDVLIGGISPLTNLIGMPAEALPMALIRPLSGSGANAVLLDTLKTYGADSFVGFLVSVMNGSTETTFYVLALYFGSIGVRATRHTVWACLAADLTGMLAALAICLLWWS